MPHHTDTQTVPYTAQQMYDLVADVERYPEFLPWNSAVRVRSRAPLPDGPAGAELLEVDLVISFKVFRERFGSRVELYPSEKRIDTEYLDGPFSHMRSGWQFADLPEGGSRVEFFVDFEFRNAILRRVIGVVFTEAMHRIVRAFQDRARQLYR